MPSIVIHEEVGYYLSSKINKNSYEYYLGLLAPDAPNLYGFAEKKERWTSHVRKKDLEEWRKSLKEFYQVKKDKIEEDFLIGYIIHILTDIVFDDFLYKKVIESIQNNNRCSKQEAHNLMRNDMLKYHFNKEEKVYNILKNNNTSFAIQNITKEKLLNWKMKQINDQQNDNNSIYITKNIIDELNVLVEKEFEKLQKAIK